jgi:uncharacterized protein (TIGR02266 family)
MMDQPERRTSPRVPKIIEIQYTTNSPPITARITDLSEKGIFVDTMNPLTEGTIVKFKFSLTGTPSEKPIEGEGRVVWNQQIVGMGIEFKHLNEEDRGRIKLFVKNQG